MKKISSAWISEAVPAAERQHDNLVQQARSIAIRFLGLSKKPSGRVIDRLRQANFASEIIAEVLQDLQADGYLDDLGLARKMAGQRSGRQALSRQALQQRLLQAGLTETAVQAALPEPADELGRALAALAGRFAAAAAVRTADIADSDDAEPADGGDPDTQRAEQLRLSRKMGRFLLSRGFASDIARQAVHLYWKGSSDDDNEAYE